MKAKLSRVFRHFSRYFNALKQCFLIAGVAESHRLPFDLPEAEHELAAGFHTEYSGMKFGLIMIGEYLSMVLTSAMIVTLFFGGWSGWSFLPPIIWFTLKTAFVICFFILLRAAIPESARRVLDVGTGSGVLAIAAARLGASDVRGIDVDPDAVASARENLDLNPDAKPVRLETADLRDAGLAQADIVLANLTGAVLIGTASLLAGAVAPGGSLIVSGLQVHERADVLAAFADLQLSSSAEDGEWVALTFNRPTLGGV